METSIACDKVLDEILDQRGLMQIPETSSSSFPDCVGDGRKFQHASPHPPFSHPNSRERMADPAIEPTQKKFIECEFYLREGFVDSFLSNYSNASVWESLFHIDERFYPKFPRQERYAASFLPKRYGQAIWQEP